MGVAVGGGGVGGRVGVAVGKGGVGDEVDVAVGSGVGVAVGGEVSVAVGSSEVGSGVGTPVGATSAQPARMIEVISNPLTITRLPKVPLLFRITWVKTCPYYSLYLKRCPECVLLEQQQERASRTGVLALAVPKPPRS